MGSVSTQPAKRTLVDRVGSIGFALSVAFLIFLSGILASVFEWRPYRWVRDAVKAHDALALQRQMLEEEYPTWIWNETKRSERGLVQHDPAHAFFGYTLYSSGHDSIVLLVDMEGREVHRWTARFRDVFPDAEHIDPEVPDRGIFVRRAHVYPNGDLLVLFETPMDTPGGAGLAKLDVHGNVLWKYGENAHHDFTVRDDGAICTLTQEVGTTAKPGWEEVHQLPYVEDFVVVLSPEGNEVSKFSLLDAIKNSPVYSKKILWYRHISDESVLHANTIHVVSKEFASHYETISAGDFMVCSRHFDLVAVINPESKVMVWYTMGPWHFPHDPDPLENGRFLIFDNVFASSDFSGSRVLEFDPRDRRIHWEYCGNKDVPLRSDIRSCQQLLPNGNILINESDGGRILEVTRKGDIVWEYINPVRGGDNDKLIPIICGAKRLSTHEVPFLKAKINK